MDLDPSAGLARARIRDPDPSRYERFDLGFHRRLRAGFQTIAAGDPDRCVVVDASGTPDDVEAIVWAEASKRLGALPS